MDQMLQLSLQKDPGAFDPHNPLFWFLIFVVLAIFAYFYADKVFDVESPADRNRRLDQQERLEKEKQKNPPEPAPEPPPAIDPDKINRYASRSTDGKKRRRKE